MPFRKLVEGYKDFHKNYFADDAAAFHHLLDGQQPEALVIACSDSRIDPAIVTGSDPGDIFVVRNVAAIVPPYRSDSRHHGTSAAIEFAVKALKVRRIVVMGHSSCGGIKALAEQEISETDYQFIGPWINICEPARKAVEQELGDAPQELKLRALEQAGILTSLNNLLTFPWVAEVVKAGGLKIHGWYFDMANGILSEFDPETAMFKDIRTFPIGQDESQEEDHNTCTGPVALEDFLECCKKAAG